MDEVYALKAIACAIMFFGHGVIFKPEKSEKEAPIDNLCYKIISLALVFGFAFFVAWGVV